MFQISCVLITYNNNMQEAYSEFFKTIDVFFTLLQSPTISEQMTVENVTRAFNCAHFIEVAIEKIQTKDQKWRDSFEKYLNRKSKRKLFPLNITCSDLEKACDKLLECYLKDSYISTEVVDEYLKLYTQKFDCDRLNACLKQVLSKSIATNMIIESLKILGVPLSYMEDQALIMSWQMAIANGDQSEVAECVNRMLNDGHVSRLIHLTIESHDDVIKKLVIQTFTLKLIAYDSEICIAFTNTEKKLLLKLLQADIDFCINFIDAIFYFSRNMYLIDGKWCSDVKFEYEHLYCSQPNSKIWKDIIPWIKNSDSENNIKNDNDTKNDTKNDKDTENDHDMNNYDYEHDITWISSQDLI
nr:PREDICTED: uncharacterized protein LOC105670786 [Linepithema humile]